MTTDDLSHDLSQYPPLGTSPSPQRVADWERLCAWLEDQPYNASYRVACCGHLLITIQGYAVSRDGKETYDRVKRLDRERKALGLVYWASGWGWRLRKDYAAKLETLRAKFGGSE